MWKLDASDQAFAMVIGKVKEKITGLSDAVANGSCSN